MGNKGCKFKKKGRVGNEVLDEKNVIEFRLRLLNFYSRPIYTKTYRTSINCVKVYNNVVLKILEIILHTLMCKFISVSIYVG